MKNKNHPSVYSSRLVSALFFFFYLFFFFSSPAFLSLSFLVMDTLLWNWNFIPVLLSCAYIFLNREMKYFSFEESYRCIHVGWLFAMRVSWVDMYECVDVY